MTKPLCRRWLLAALFLVAMFPLLASAQSADLQVTATDNNSGASVVAGAGVGGIDYTFTVTNNGPDGAADVASELLLTITAGSFINCAPPAASEGVVNLISQFSVAWTGVDLALDEFATIDLSCTPSASVPDGDTFGAELAITGFTGTDPDDTNDSASLQSTIIREVNFDLTVDCFPDSVIAGGGTGNLECTLDFTQNGPSQASNVNVNLTLPAGVTVDSAIVSGAASTFNLPTNWSLGTKNPGESSTALLTMTVDATATGDLTISAAATANETIVNGPVSDDDLVVSEAAAAGPTTFLTTIGFTNGYPGEVTVMISCNNGSPLEQDFEISVGTPVDFVVDVLDFLAPDVNCEVTLVSVDDGYVGNFLANGVDTGDSCFFASEPEAGEAPFDQTAERMNTCEITAEPVASTFEVEKVWEFEGDDIVGLVAGIEIWCSPASTTTGPNYTTVSTFRYFEGDGAFGLGFYPHWNGETTCYAGEPDVDSSVESDNGCAAGTAFAVGDDEKGCVITNTVFFEGIPTLSQYGLALMALLMLGVGFVGLRRFV